MYFIPVVPGPVAVEVEVAVAPAGVAVAVPGLKVVVVAPPGLQAVHQAAVQVLTQGRAVMYPKKMVCYTERFGIMSRKRFD